MRRCAVGAAIILGLSVAVFLMVACTAATAPPAAATAPASPAPGPSFLNSSQRLVPSAEASKIDSATALAKVREVVSVAQATSIVVGKYRFTSDELAESVVAKNALVWVVTLNGVTVLPRGGVSLHEDTASPRPVYHQLNVVVDANTGALVVAIPGR
jgi:hypothetical protein